MRHATALGTLACFLALWGCPGRVRAEPLPEKYRQVAERGLDWLAKQQYRDGHWEASGGRYPVAMTGMCGMAMLAEGSNLRSGKYAPNIRRAADWLMARSMPNGMIGNPSNPSEASRYMYGHGYSMLFLSSVYGGEEDEDRRRRLNDILTRGALFTHRAQTDKGGWGYVSAKEGRGFDEGSVTITQVQALRAARNAGIAVPRKAIDMAVDYLRKSTTADGGVIYSLASGGRGSGRPALTAAAISCGFSAGEYNSPLVKKWFQFCRKRLAPLGDRRMGHDEYTHYYYAQALYMLGDNGWAKLFPESKPGDRLTWSDYRDKAYEHIARTQNSDGGWTGQIGPVYVSAIYLTILQLDKGVLPIYQQ
jgi:hypothetical protein